MDKNVNPWTGKTKTSRNSGLFNDLLFKHYPELERPAVSNPYLELVSIIEAQKNQKNAEEYLDIFDLKIKMNKM